MRTVFNASGQHRTRRQWLSLVEQSYRYDGSLAQFCRQVKVSEASMSRWRRIAREQSETVAQVKQKCASGFIDGGVLEFGSGSLAKDETGTLNVRIELGGGVVLTLTRD